MEFKTKTIRDAFEATNRNPDLLPDVSMLPEKDRHIIDYYNLTVVTEAINQESNGGKPWKPNYNDFNEKKWEIWFGIEADEKHPSGVGFSDSVTFCERTGTGVGSRLCFHSEEALRYAVKKFEKLYELVIIQK